MSGSLRRGRGAAIVALLFLGLVAGLSMSGASIAGAARPGKARACTLTVRFGSYAMGIDGGAARSVEQLLRADKAVRSIDRRPWGREGEYDLCARIPRPAEAKRLFDRIRSVLPAKPRGPITVTLGERRSYSVPAQ